MIVEAIQTERFSVDTPARSASEAMEVFRKLYPHASILKIDGRDVEGLCHVCGRPVLSGEPFIRQYALLQLGANDRVYHDSPCFEQRDVRHERSGR